MSQEKKQDLILKALGVFKTSMEGAIDTVVNIRDTLDEALREMGNDDMLQATFMQARDTLARLYDARHEYMKFQAMMTHIVVYAHKHDEALKEESDEGQEGHETDQ